MSRQARPRALTSRRARSISSMAVAEIGRIQSVVLARSLPCQASGPVMGRAVTVLMEPGYKPRGTRPATARTLRGAASYIAPGDTALTAIAIQNGSRQILLYYSLLISGGERC